MHSHLGVSSEYIPFSIYPVYTFSQYEFTGLQISLFTLYLFLARKKKKKKRKRKENKNLSLACKSPPLSLFKAV